MTGSETAIRVTWEAFHRDACQLAGRLAGAGTFSAIVAVSRGGLMPAAIVARELGLRIVETVSIASYEGETAQGALRLLKPVAPEVLSLPHERLLFVDDLADTGATASALRAMAPGAHLSALYAKPRGAPRLDTYVRSAPQDCWIYFPWDLDAANDYRAPLRPE
jgi:xanthine phosphoribosyltransferase